MNEREDAIDRAAQRGRVPLGFGLGGILVFGTPDELATLQAKDGGFTLAPPQPIYTDCSNCGSVDHRVYRCPCGCHV
jgi:hypothetical protein